MRCQRAKGSAAFSVVHIMSDRFVYVVAFAGERFVMVRHARRAWEMPGGRVIPGETDEQAGCREFFEETGRTFVPVGAIEVDGGMVLVGPVGPTLSRPDPGEIAEVSEFSSLPGELSFPLVEYEKVVSKARTIMESFKSNKAIDGPASPQAKP